jgi:hypothetical protein
MKLSKLIAIADKVYPDGMIGMAYKAEPKEDVGDTLATFIVRELRDTYDEKASDKEQLQEAARVIRAAVTELDVVQEAFQKAL